MRKPFLDHIRWAAVLLVLVYHVCYLYNGVGILGGIPGAESIAAFDVLAGLVYPWLMVLLFVVAGVSARYALQKRTAAQFLKERARKLLLPSTLGLFVLHWVTGYLNLRLGGGLAYIPAPLVYPISVLSGIGPLWFIQMLFLFSCVLSLLHKLDRADRIWRFCGTGGAGVDLLLFLVLWGAAQIGNVPVLTMYRFGIYSAAVLIGYFRLSHEGVQSALARLRIPLFAAALACGAAYAFFFGGSNYTAPACLQSIWTCLYLWAAVLAIFGWARQYAVWETGLTRYLTQASFGLYILHYPVLMLTGYVLSAYTALPAIWVYLLTLLLEFILTFALYALVRRIPGVRVLVLGQRKHGPR